MTHALTALAPDRLRRVLVLAAGGSAFFGGVLTLLGWWLDIPRLIDWDGDGISMKANTAFCAAAAGFALASLELSLPKRFVRIPAALIALIGVLTLLEHVTGWDFRIDTLLAHEPFGTAATAAPGRMGPPASSSFVILGGALLLATGGARARDWAAGLAIPVMGLVSLSILGYLYNAGRLYTIPRLTGIALQTSLLLASLSAGLIAALPRHGIPEAFRRRDAGGLALRRLTLPIILFPVVIGWLRLKGQEAGLYDTAFGTALFVLLVVGTLLALLWWTAKGASRDEEKIRSFAADMERQVHDRTRDLKASNEDLEAFSYSVSHDLRTPLRTITGFIQVLEESLSGKLDERTKANLRRIEDGSRDMSRLIDNLLELSRVARKDLVRESVDLGAIARTLIDDLRRLQPERRVEFRDEPGLSVEGDAALLKSVLQNLLGNAWKFTGKCERAEIEFGKAREGETIVFFVRDNGTGFPPSGADRLFGVFQRLHSEDEFPGTGVGLSIVRRIVHRHGGEIRGENRKDAPGAVFSFTLPASRAGGAGS